MKVESFEEKGWKPVKLTISIDTVEEARLLFHVLDRNRLLDAMREGGVSYPNKGVASEFSGHDYNIIEDIIRGQGFPLEVPDED